MEYVTIDIEDDEFVQLLRILVRGPSVELKNNKGKMIYSAPYPPICYIVEKQIFETIIEELKINYFKPNLEKLLKEMQSPKFDIISFIMKSEKVHHSGITMGFIVEMRDNIISHLIAKKGEKVLIGQPAIFLCPENIRVYAQNIEQITEKKFRKKVLSAITKFILFHELGHYLTMPHGDIPDIRVSEALANYFAFGSADTELDKYIYYKTVLLDADSSHHYFLVLNHLDQTPQIYDEFFNGNIKKGIELFYYFFGNQMLQEQSGKSAVQINDAKGWPCFGSDKVLFLCSGSIGLLANVRSGIICCSSIKILDGLFPKTTIIWTNKVENYPTPIAPNPCLIIDKGILDFSKIITDDIDRLDLEEQIRSGIPPNKIRIHKIKMGPFYICIPCVSCECFTRTTKTIENPRIPIEINIINARCEFCGKEVNYSGKLIMSYSKDGYLANIGNQQITKLFDKTIKLLEEKESPH